MLTDKGALRRQTPIAATLMRGGTSKGLFFRRQDLPDDPSVRDAQLLRAMGSPDPYGGQIDGLGGATSSTSKVVIVSPSAQPDCDVDYLFGQVAIDRPQIDWSGSCGNLAAAVGPFALHAGWVKNAPDNGNAVVRIWQVNRQQRIVAHVPLRDGQVQELGDFEVDGVPHSAAEICLDFYDPSGNDLSLLLPTGQTRDVLNVPSMGEIQATLINAGNPTVLVGANAFGLDGTELPSELNANASLLMRCEAVRLQAAQVMGLGRSGQRLAQPSLATPKLALVASARSYAASNGAEISGGDIDVLVRMLSMGKFHHAIPGTGAIAVAAAAALPDTVLDGCLRRPQPERLGLRMGHASGRIKAHAEALCDDRGQWAIRRVSLSRSARRLMSGQIWVPEQL